MPSHKRGKAFCCSTTISPARCRMAETRTPIISFKIFSFQYRAQKQPTLLTSIWTSTRGARADRRAVRQRQVHAGGLHQRPEPVLLPRRVHGHADRGRRGRAPQQYFLSWRATSARLLQGPRRPVHRPDGGGGRTSPLRWKTAALRRTKCTDHPPRRRAGRHREPPRLRSARAFRRPEAARQPCGRHGRRGEDFTVR